MGRESHASAAAGEGGAIRRTWQEPIAIQEPVVSTESIYKSPAGE
jgi:hypothetical protein